MLGSGPSRNAKTTNLLQELVGHNIPEIPEGDGSSTGRSTGSENAQPDLDRKIEAANSEVAQNTDSEVAQKTSEVAQKTDCDHISAIDASLDLSKGATMDSDAMSPEEPTEGFSKYYTRHFLPTPVVQWTPPQNAA